ncbi:hypothetical protein [Chitiniphilus shinanonensis]|uniref:hypothetical protein n=1 Tax=Chitiniphilus shinanonensis TaxID=553088 RepID=UPI0033414CA3
MNCDYTQTQPYRLGKLYKELGEMLMDPRTDLSVLAVVAHHLGCNITISLEGREDETGSTWKEGEQP